MKTVAKIVLLVIAFILILIMLQNGPRAQNVTSGDFTLPTSTISPLPLTTDPAQIEIVTATPSAPSTPPIFRDDFNGVLAPGWVWINEDATAWSLSAFPGYLQVSVADGTVRDGDAKNLLLFPIPEGDIQVTTMFTFSPNENFQFAGLIFYQSEANHFQVGRSFCRGYGTPCIEAGIYVQFFKNYRIDTPNVATAYDTYAPILLRVTRRGNEYELDISGDGEVWIRYAKYTLDYEPTYVGIIASQNQEVIPIHALFDFFEIRKPTE